MIFFYSVYCLAILACIVAGIRNVFTYKNHTIIDTAIFLYQMDLINDNVYEFDVSCGDEESYESTLKRWWDWGYERILPPEKYEIIKPYISRAKVYVYIKERRKKK